MQLEKTALWVLEGRFPREKGNKRPLHKENKWGSEAVMLGGL